MSAQLATMIFAVVTTFVLFMNAPNGHRSIGAESSIFSTLKSWFVVDDDRECVPLISSKPSWTQNSIGTMTVMPEISKDSKDNTVIISLISRTNALSVQLSSDIWLSFRKYDIVDWGPKPVELPMRGKGVNIVNADHSIKWETHEYIDDNRLIQKRPRLPAQKYWVKLRAQQTTPWVSDQNVGFYGWKEVKYHIHYVEGAGLRTEDFKTVSGNNFYYVGGPQYPVGTIVRVGNNAAPHYGKFVTVKAGEPFTIEARPTGWQGGTMTIDTGLTANIIGPSSITVKASESAIWRVLPRGTYPVEGKVYIKNNCNNLITNLFSDRVINTYVGSFEAPIKFDFNGVAKEKMRLTFQGAESYVLDFGKPQSTLTVTPWLSLMDGQFVVAPAPDHTIVMQAVYKDNPQEVVKNILITPEGKIEQKGFAQAITDKEGTTRFKIRASSVTKQELSRGILLQTSTPSIPGLTGQVQLLFTGVSVDVTPKPTPAPTPIPKSETAPKSRPIIEGGESGAHATGMTIAPSRKLDGLKEGNTITFTATIILSDGSVKKLNDGVRWAVAGKIGNISPNGVFIAQLDPEIAEYGEGLGAIIVTYQDTNGKEFSAQTSIFRVEAKFDENINTDG